MTDVTVYVGRGTTQYGPSSEGSLTYMYSAQTTNIAYDQCSAKRLRILSDGFKIIRVTKCKFEEIHGHSNDAILYIDVESRSFVKAIYGFKQIMDISLYN